MTKTVMIIVGSIQSSRLREAPRIAPKPAGNLPYHDHGPATNNHFSKLLILIITNNLIKIQWLVAGVHNCLCYSSGFSA